MKKILMNMIVAGVSMMTACSEDSQLNETVSANLTTGTWKVLYFMDNNTDETYKFTGFEFTFSGNNVVIAKNNDTEFEGTWLIQHYDDGGKLKLVLDFGVHVPLDELNDDWHLVEQTQDLLHFNDVSGGNGTVEELKLARI